MPARCSSSSGRRSQPPRPTTIVSGAAASRAHSSETRPSRMRTIRSATLADSGSWLTSSVVQPCSRTRSPTSSYTWSAVAASSSPVGSSARKTRGRWASAAHSATRCCSPPESSPGRRSRFAPRPTRSSSSSARRSRTVLALAAQPELQRDEPPCAQLGGERAGVVLVDIAEQVGAVVGEPARRQLADLLAEDADDPCRGLLDAGEDPQQRRLAGPARPEHGDDLSLVDGERETLQRGRVALGRRVDAEDVAHLDRAQTATSAARSGARPPSRVAAATSAAASRA